MDSTVELIELLNKCKGVELNIDMMDYHKRAQGLGTVMSSHQLMQYDHMPWKFLVDKRQTEDKDTVSKRKGRALHTRVLEPHLFDKSYKSGAFGPKHLSGKNVGKRLGPKSIAYMDWVKDLGAVGITVLPEKEYNDVIAMGESVREGHCGHFFTGGLSEVTFTTIINGVPFQVRPDYIKQEYNDAGERCLLVPDLKTCRDIEWFEYDAGEKKYNYVLQLAIYRYVIHCVTQIPLANIRSTLIAVDPAPYFITGEFLPTVESLDESQYQMTSALDRYSESILTNSWPTGYERYTPIGVS